MSLDHEEPGSDQLVRCVERGLKHILYVSETLKGVKG